MPDKAGAVGSTSATSPDEAKRLAIRGEGAVGSTVDVTVVVVSYNSRNWLERCLSPVVHQSGDVLGLEVIVVDNASTDGSAAFVRERFPGVTVIESNVNLGFGAGCNRAFAVAKGRTIILVNPDCELQPGAIGALHRFLRDHPRIGAVGGRLAYGDGSFQHAAFRFPSLAQVFLDFFPMNWRLTESRLNGRYPRAIDTTAFECDAVLGALMAIRRTAIAGTGGFDERYFMYVEEIDWCKRLRAFGWEVWHCPDAMGVHHSGQSTRTVAARMFVELHRSRLHYFRRYWPPATVAIARVITWIGCAREIMRLRRRAPDDASRERIRGCREVMRLVA